MMETEKVIRYLLETDYASFSPHEINQGLCWELALKVQEEVSHVVNLAGDPTVMVETSHNDFLDHICFPRQGHVWIWDPDTERHHDSECPEGVFDWKDLPFFARNHVVNNTETLQGKSPDIMKIDQA